MISLIYPFCAETDSDGSLELTAHYAMKILTIVARQIVSFQEQFREL